MCESFNPGITVRPPASTTRVAAPRWRMTSRSSPTATKRPPRIATADARGSAASIVATRPWCRIRSASGTGSARAPIVAPSALLRLDDLRPLRGLRRLVHHRVRVLDARAVGAGVLLQDLHQGVVVLLVRPVALPLE